MKLVILVVIVALAAARPQSSDIDEEIQEHLTFDYPKIIRDDRHHADGTGSYSFDIETEDGIIRSEAGGPLEHLESRPVGQQGSYSFTFPDGRQFNLKYVANENGYQPESSWLPVAPAFPHPIPQFVLDQIARAQIEREEARTREAEESIIVPVQVVKDFS